jgi:diguanylate cyclase (GGDEF)-like protein
MRVTAQLVVLGPDDSRVVPLDSRPVTFASHLANEVRLRGEFVSPHHCSIVPAAGGGHRLVGLETYKQLLLNGRKVKEARLEPFDRIRLGAYDFVYLPGDVDASRVQSLLASPDAATRRLPPAQVRSAQLRERLLWLLLMTQSLPPGSEVGPVLDMIMEEVIRWTGYDCAALVLRRRDRSLDLIKSLRLSDDAIKSSELDGFSPLAERVLATGEVYTGSSPFTAFERALCLPVRNVWASAHERRRYPIGHVEGILVLGGEDTPHEPLGDECMSLLQALTRQIAILLGNMRVFRQATVDPLTGLATRTCIDRIVEEELARAAELRGSVVFLLLDVDDFKFLNDTYGHLVGDEVLEHLAGRLRAELRCDDFACRWGGEEFLVILPGTDLGGAQTVADKIIRNVTWFQSGREGPRVTVSAGLAAYPHHGDSFRELMDRADKALYQAKRNGKSRYEVFGFGVLGEADTTRPSAGEGGDALSTANEVGQWILRNPLLEPVLLRPGRVTLGRSTSADVCLFHPKVSRQHGVLEIGPDGGVRFEDRSSNGTLLNGRPVQRSVELLAGDVLSVGPFDLEVSLSTSPSVGPLPELPPPSLDRHRHVGSGPGGDL